MEIDYDGTEEEWEKIHIGTDAIPVGVTVRFKPSPPVLRIPGSTVVIESEAFAGIENDYSIVIPATVTGIADDAFGGATPIIIAPPDSYAARWAAEHHCEWRAP